MSRAATRVGHTTRGWLGTLAAALAAVALVEALALCWFALRPAPARSYTPLLPADATVEQTAALGMDGGTRAAAAARLSTVGTVLTVEDLVRGLLRLTDADAAEPLDAAQRAALLPLVEEAYRVRMELLDVERQRMELAASAAAEGAAVRAGLTDTQQRAIERERDALSIVDVENRYWEQLIEELERGERGG